MGIVYTFLNTLWYCWSHCRTCTVPMFNIDLIPSMLFEWIGISHLAKLGEASADLAGIGQEPFGSPVAQWADAVLQVVFEEYDAYRCPVNP